MYDLGKMLTLCSAVAIERKTNNADMQDNNSDNIRGSIGLKFKQSSKSSKPEKTLGRE